MDLAEPLGAIISPLLEGRYLSGCSIGIAARGRETFLTFGQLPAGVGENPLFEIGSITKPMVALATVAWMLENNVDLDLPVNGFLADHLRVPVWNGTEVTFRHLLSHSSGLPFAADEKGGVAVSETALAGFVPRQALAFQPGSRAHYSNLGYMVLGYALRKLAGLDIHELVERYLTQRLNLVDTAYVLNPQQQGRLGPGHDYDGDPAEKLFLPEPLNAAGGLISSVPDLLTLARSHTEEGEAAGLRAAMNRCCQPQAPFQEPHYHQGESAGLGWIVHGVNASQGYHGGRTYGYEGVVAFDRRERISLVILCHSVCPYVLNLARAIRDLLDGKKPEALILPRIMAISSEARQPYRGTFLLSNQQELHVSGDAYGLIARIVNGPTARLYPRADNEFYTRTGLTVTFPDRGLQQVLLDRPGLHVEGSRIR